MKIASWNVNSIRARFDAFIYFIKKYNPDIILLQETKVIDELFPFNIAYSNGYNTLVSGQKSYNGVAILSKFPIELELKNLQQSELFPNDTEARYIEASFSFNNNFIKIASVYVPNGASTEDSKLEESVRFKYKLNFYDRLINRIQEINKNDETFIMGGDFNVALTDIDLFNPKSAANDVGFHPMEKEKMNQIIANQMPDIYRTLNIDNGYTWWDYRNRNSLQNNLGWRIDYILASEKIKSQIKKCYVCKDIRSIEKTSDHAPLMIEF